MGSWAVKSSYNPGEPELEYTADDSTVLDYYLSELTDIRTPQKTFRPDDCCTEAINNAKAMSQVDYQALADEVNGV